MTPALVRVEFDAPLDEMGVLDLFRAQAKSFGEAHVKLARTPHVEDAPDPEGRLLRPAARRIRARAASSSVAG